MQIKTVGFCKNFSRTTTYNSRIPHNLKFKTALSINMQGSYLAKYQTDCQVFETLLLTYLKPYKKSY